MLIISIRFLTGRAHLHPWQNASTQTDIDWPPSPWRFLRSLVAVAGRGLTHLPGNPQIKSPLSDWEMGKMIDVAGQPISEKITHSHLAELLLQLARKPPIIWLPRTQIGHLRLFQPDDQGNRSGDRMGSPFLDCFASIDPSTPIYFQWGSVELSDEKIQDLNALLARLYYFGRSESWCQAELLYALPDSLEQNQTHWRCPCIEDSDEATRESLGQEHLDYDVKRRLAWNGTDFQAHAQRLLGFSGKLEEARKKQLIEEEKWRNKSVKKDGSRRDKTKAHKEAETAVKLWDSITSETPSLTLLRCLLRETGEDRSGSAGLPRPIGTRWVHYAVPREIFRVPTWVSSKTTPNNNFRYNPQSVPEVERVQVVRFAINTDTAHRAVLPNVTATVAVSQRIRTVALGLFGKQNEDKLSPQLVGKSLGNLDCPWELFDRNRGDVAPLRDHASHAHWWLTDEDHDGFLDHLNIVCENGFSRADVAALQSLVKVQQRDNFPDLLLTPIFVGRLNSLTVPGFFEPAENAINFVSVTPYFCPIHLMHGKKSGGRMRSLWKPIRKELGPYLKVDRIQEILFDYESDHLTTAPESGIYLGPRFSGSWLKDPDATCLPGQNRGFYVAKQSRFIPSHKFSSTRKNERTIGPGRMLLIKLSAYRSARPFALGKFSHFGLGLFVPVYAEGAS